MRLLLLPLLLVSFKCAELSDPAASFEVMLFDQRGPSVENGISDRYGEGRVVTFSATVMGYTDMEACAMIAREAGVPFMACKVFTAAGVVFPSGVEKARAAEVGSLYIVSIHQRWVYPTIAEGHRVNLTHLKEAVPGKQMQLETVAHAPRLFKVHNVLSQEEIDYLLAFAESQGLATQAEGIRPFIPDEKPTVTSRRSSEAVQ
jgi:hypothetical protein